MSENFILSRTKQCKTCPWKVGNDPHDIPNGYSEVMHRNLKNTISNPGEIRIGKPVNAMACHHSEVGNEQYCIGWLINQMGPGNNIGLRIKMIQCENFKDVEVYGEQYQTFEQTLPKNKNRL